MSENLKFRYDVDNDILKIEGIKYSGELFRQWAHGMPLEQPMKITAREDGVLTLVAMEPHDPDWRGPGPKAPEGHVTMAWRIDGSTKFVFIPHDADAATVARKLRALAAVIEGPKPAPTPEVPAEAPANG